LQDFQGLLQPAHVPSVLPRHEIVSGLGEQQKFADMS
jgi:hypothetical protein